MQSMPGGMVAALITANDKILSCVLGNAVWCTDFYLEFEEGIYHLIHLTFILAEN